MDEPWTERREIGPCTLYLADSTHVPKPLISCDSVVTDPPYGIGWKPRVTHQDQSWCDNEPFDPSPWLEVGDHHVFWGAQHFAHRLPPSDGWLAWIKRPLGLNFSEDKRSYASMELAWRDWGKPRHKEHVWDGGMRAGDPENREFLHPAQKPVEVMLWAIGLLPKTVKSVLDPFMGSGTTGVACVKRGFAFIGIEREPDYFEVACRRIEEAQRQPDMFLEVT